MSYKRKISVIILGRDEALKKALITNILGKDLSKLFKRAHKQIEIYENDMCEVTFTPDLHVQCEDIQDLFFYHQYPDLCLLVVEDGFSPEDVLNQIEHLSKTTGKPTKEFVVLLPLSCKPTDYPFRSCTMQQVFSELDKLPEGRNVTRTRTRYTVNPVPHLSTPNTQMGREGKHTSIKVNLVLLGMSGTGKSASGNTILRKRVFLSMPSSKQVTRKCQVEETDIKGVHVRVIDTPDMFDDGIDASVKGEHVKSCKELCEFEPCVFVLVMHVSRFTDGERDILTKLEKAFGSKVKEQTVILFTKANDLYRDGTRLDDFFHNCQPNLKEIIEKCGKRCVLFENSRSSSAQVERLLEMVIRVLEKQQKL